MSRVVCVVAALGVAALQGESWGQDAAIAQERQESFFAAFAQCAQTCRTACLQGESVLLFRSYKTLWNLLARAAPTLEAALSEGIDPAFWDRLAITLLTLCLYGQKILKSKASSLGIPPTKPAPKLSQALKEEPLWNQTLREAPILGSALQILALAIQEVEALPTQKNEVSASEEQLRQEEAKLAQRIARLDPHSTPQTIQKILKLCSFIENWQRLTQADRAELRNAPPLKFNQPASQILKASDPTSSQATLSSQSQASLPTEVAMPFSFQGPSSSVLTSATQNTKQDHPLSKQEELLQLHEKLTSPHSLAENPEHNLTSSQTLTAAPQPYTQAGSPEEAHQLPSSLETPDLELAVLFALEFLKPQKASHYRKKRLESVQKLLGEFKKTPLS